MLGIKVSLKGSLDVAAQGAHTSLCRSMLAKRVKHVSRNLMIAGVTQRGVVRPNHLEWALLGVVQCQSTSNSSMRILSELCLSLKNLHVYLLRGVRQGISTLPFFALLEDGNLVEVIHRPLQGSLLIKPRTLITAF
jgi:hypothetical protein